jgi:hypothetical protein
MLLSGIPDRRFESYPLRHFWNAPGKAYLSIPEVSSRLDSLMLSPSRLDLFGGGASMRTGSDLGVFLLGVLAMGDLIAAMFFLKYWIRTTDRFFFYFIVSFGLEVVCRYLLMYTTFNTESEPLVYSLRLFSYAIILVGIADKNRNIIRRILFQDS